MRQGIRPMVFGVSDLEVVGLWNMLGFEEPRNHKILGQFSKAHIGEV